MCPSPRWFLPIRKATALSFQTKVRCAVPDGVPFAHKDGKTLATSWLRQLQVIPGLSELRARALFDAYPTAHALLSQYGVMHTPSGSATTHTLSEQQRRQLLAVRGCCCRLQCAVCM